MRAKDLEATAPCGPNKWRVLESDWVSGHAKVKQWGELSIPGVHRSVISRNAGRVKAAFIPCKPFRHGKQYFLYDFYIALDVICVEH